MEDSVNLAVQRMVDIALALQWNMVSMQKSNVVNITTYQFQFLQFHKSLFHTGLVHLNLLVLLAKREVEVFLTVIIATRMFVQCARFVL